jgi:putative transcriptional regulator
MLVALAGCAGCAGGGEAKRAQAEEARPAEAILITARGELQDPFFRDAVVLVTNGIGRGPVGVIMNRPTRMPVARLFPDIETLAKVNARVYFGGPVRPGAVSFLFRAGVPPEHATAILDGIYLSTDEDLLRTLLARDHPMEGLRIFAGHSGWAPGQLEAEIARGDWKLEPAKPDRVFEWRRELPWPEPEGPDKEHRG